MTYTNEGGSSPQLKVLDQLLVPHEKVYLDVPDVEMAYTVIKTMQIRGMYQLFFWRCLWITDRVLLFLDHFYRTVWFLIKAQTFFLLRPIATHIR
jgi:hypothetical protein